MAFDLIGKAKRRLRIPTVDYSASSAKNISAQTGDVNSRFFVVELYDDEGNINLAKYTKVILSVTFAENDVRCVDGEIDKEKNLVICKIPAMETAGKFECDISLIGEDDGETVCLTSQTFSVTVLKSQANDEAIETDDNYPILVQLISDVSGAVSAEKKRVEAEALRESAEIKRKEAETGRATAETQRVNAEEIREGSEVERLAAEDNRVLNEKIRQGSETGRINAENIRSTAETERAAAEANRSASEEQRGKSETERKTNETLRISNEKDRENAEISRVNAENGRVEAEKSRVEAEKQRVALSERIQEKIDAKQDALSFDGQYNKDSNKVATVNTVITKVAEIVAGAPEDFDTLKELADWLTNHSSDAATMNSQIQTNTAEIAEVKTSVNTIKDSVLGVNGTITIKPADWSNKTYSVIITDLGENDAIFLSPIELNDKTALEESNVYTAVVGDVVIFTAIENAPTTEIKLNYYISRGK